MKINLIKGLLVLGLLAMSALPQSSSVLKEFEVATIRVAPQQSVQERSQNPLSNLPSLGKRQVRLPYVSMEGLLRYAFNLPMAQIIAPRWIASSHYSVAALIPADSTPKDLPAMFEALLSMRFGMAYHRETRTTTAYALTVAAAGFKASILESAPPPASQIPHAEQDGSLTTNIAATSEKFAEHLTERMRILVVDKTGLPGLYQFSYSIHFLPTDQGETPPKSVQTILLQMYQEALSKAGLRLSPINMPVEHVIVDRLEKVPTDN